MTWKSFVCVVVSAVTYNLLIRALMRDGGGVQITQGLVLGINNAAYTYPEIKYHEFLFFGQCCGCGSDPSPPTPLITVAPPRPAPSLVSLLSPPPRCPDSPHRRPRWSARRRLRARRCRPQQRAPQIAQGAATDGAALRLDPTVLGVFAPRRHESSSLLATPHPL